MELKKIKEIFSFEKGSLQSSKCTAGEYNFITASSKWKTHNSFDYECEALVVAVAASGSLGRVHYINDKFISSDLCFVLKPKDSSKFPVNLEFYYSIFKSLKEDLVKSTATGTAKKSINKTNFGNYVIPYYNIEEQNRLKPVFEKVADNSEKINQELRNQKQLLSKLKQSILQEAIQGKLTANWREKNPNTESASNLLERISEEKAQLIKDKKLKKGNTINHPRNLIAKDSFPNSWVKIKADKILFVTKLAGFEYSKHISLQDTGEIPVIRAQNVRPLNINKNNLLYIDRKTSLLLDRCSLTKQCLLVTFIGAGIGDIATFKENERWHLAPNVAKMEPFEGCENLIDITYLNYFLLSPIGRDEVFKHIKATAQPSLSMSTIRDIDFLIPPLEEQKAIVKKVESLMQKCMALEQEIKNSEANAQMLMQAVLKEAVEGKKEEVVI